MPAGSRFDLGGKVALVTGASKNIGKGIAVEVGAQGAITYITARSVTDVPGQLASLDRTAAEIAAAGGKAIPVAVMPISEETAQEELRD